MRSRLIGIVAALAVFGLIVAACASKETPSGGGSGTPGITTIKGSGILTVGSCLDYKPFETVKPGSEEPTGFDVELTNAIAAKLDLKVEWVKANFNTIFTQVNQGKFDMVAAAVTATGSVGKKRAQTVDFSDFYYNSEQGFTVNTQQTPDVKSVDDLTSGDVVGVQAGTTGEQWAKDNLAPKGIQIKSYPAAPQAFTDLADRHQREIRLRIRQGIHGVGAGLERWAPRGDRGRDVRDDLHEVLPRRPGAGGVPARVNRGRRMGPRRRRRGPIPPREGEVR